MGIGVRTCRPHIAKLRHTLGATSRTHLGALLAHSGTARAGHGGTWGSRSAYADGAGKAS